MFAGQVTFGFSVSLTVTLKTQLSVFPDASVAAEVTVVVPLGKLEPEGGVEVRVTPGQLSLAVALKLTTAEHWPGSVPVTMSAGQITFGFSVSLTVTVKTQLSVFPEASVAVQVTAVVPFGKLEPESGVEVKVTPGQLSLAVALKLTTAEHWPRSVPVTMSAGQVTFGFSVSLTVTEKFELCVFPEASVAVHVTVVVPFGKLEPEGGVV